MGRKCISIQFTHVVQHLKSKTPAQDRLKRLCDSLKNNQEHVEKTIASDDMTKTTITKIQHCDDAIGNNEPADKAKYEQPNKTVDLRESGRSWVMYKKNQP